jgi:hypothetical protein
MSKNNESHICETCGSLGEPKSITKGSLVIEICLWMLLILPGMIYSVWRLSTRRKGCSQCEGNMLPIDSPKGFKLWEELHGPTPNKTRQPFSD